MHAKTTKGMSEDWAYYFQHLYPYATDSFNAPLDPQPNGEWGDDTHPSDIKLGYLDSFNKAIPPSGYHGNANMQFANPSADEVFEDTIENYGHGPTEEGSGVTGSGVAAPTKIYDKYVVITPQPKVIRDRIIQQASNNLIGYSKCQIIGQCDARHPGLLGAPCINQRTQKGFCNYDAEGDYLCMRTALWWSYGAVTAGQTDYLHDVRETVGYQSSSTNASASMQPVACTPGTAATTDLSGEWQPRLLVGGCMISTDSFHTGWEEVHLPDACNNNVSLPDEQIGCMDKGARNWDPKARQPGKCLYTTEGCTNSLALNYNSEATDDDNSCILGTCGCNMGAADGDAYLGVNPETLKYESLFVGKPLAGLASNNDIGKVTYPAYSAVLQDYTTNPQQYASGTTPALVPSGTATTATVLGGRTCGGSAEGSLCTFTIEGCMSSTAINYNPLANKNSNTWCVEPQEGCMMPDVERSSGYSNTRTSLKNNRFGYALSSGSGFYDTSATVHTSCTVYNKGCMDSSAANYFSWATYPDTCYPKKIGCAHPKALNYGCTEYVSPSGTGVGGQVILPCTAGQEGGSEPITNHEPSFCNFYEISCAECQKTATSAQVTMTTSAECTSLTDSDMQALQNYWLQRIGANPTISKVCGSLKIQSSFTDLSADQYRAFQLVSLTALSTNDGATNFLAQAGLEGFYVISLTITQVEDTAFPPPSSPPMSAEQIGLIVGCVLAGVVVVVLAVAAFFLLRKKNKPVAPQ